MRSSLCRSGQKAIAAMKTWLPRSRNAPDKRVPCGCEFHRHVQCKPTRKLLGREVAFPREAREEIWNHRRDLWVPTSKTAGNTQAADVRIGLSMIHVRCRPPAAMPESKGRWKTKFKDARWCPDLVEDSTSALVIHNRLRHIHLVLKKAALIERVCDGLLCTDDLLIHRKHSITAPRKG